MEESTVKFTSRTLAHFQHSLNWMGINIPSARFLRCCGDVSTEFTRVWAGVWNGNEWVNYKLLGNENVRLLWVGTPLSMEFPRNRQLNNFHQMLAKSAAICHSGRRTRFLLLPTSNFQRTIVSPSEVAWKQTIIGILEVEQPPFTCLGCLFQHNRFSQLIIEIT